MNPEKKCQNCGEKFLVDQEESSFFKKIKIPEPTFCAECRLQRRLAWKNEQMLYSRTCDLCKKPTISIYRPEATHPVYCNTCWWSDAWNPLSYGQEFNFEKPFFEQFAELMHKVPRPAVICEQSENCTYSHNTTFSKNCYLCFTCVNGENCYFNYGIKDCKDTVDGMNLTQCELCYECTNCQGCYNCNFMDDCENCIDSSNCHDCKSLRNCFGCINLQHKEYHIFNQPVTKEYYDNFIKNLESEEFFASVQQQFQDFKKSYPHRTNKNINAEHCTGDHISFSKNAQNCFNIAHCEDVKNTLYAANLKDSMDVSGSLMGGELQYETSAAGASNNVQFACLSWHNTDSQYINYCNTCINIFGCIGLKKAKYCILNKQYGKEEYTELLQKILEYMRVETVELGQFFPISISPYAYNETSARHYCPLTKEEALRKGYRWIDEAPVRKMEGGKTCKKCGKSYKIIDQEMEFYKRKKLPYPQNCPDCRYEKRIARTGIFKLIDRQCTHCNKAIQTTLSPEKVSTIYCNECYMALNF